MPRLAYRVITLFCSLLCLQAIAGELTVPKNTPIIPWTRFSIQYTVMDVGGAGTKAVEFYITTDMGKTWKKYGEDPDVRSPMMIRVDGDGVYGFMTVGTDMVGNRERPPVPGTRPETVVIVDRTPPTAKWLSPTKSGLMPPGGVTLSWESRDKHLGAGPVSLEYSSNGTTWLPLKDRLPATGNFTWKPVNQIGGTVKYRIITRDEAGNQLKLECRHKTILDNKPPQVTITGPAQSSTLSVDLQYEANDNHAGIERVTLYYTIDNGQEWKRLGDDPDSVSPMRFNSAVTGPVGLMLIAADKAGNSNPPPHSGVRPPFVIEFDTEPPLIQIDRSFLEGKTIIGGGDKRVVRWTATDTNIKSKSATLSWSIDGGETWHVEAKELPANGSYDWKVPAENSKNCLLRVTVADKLGNVGEGQSVAFTIDSTHPRLYKLEIEKIPDNKESPVIKDDNGYLIKENDSSFEPAPPSPDKTESNQPLIPASLVTPGTTSLIEEKPEPVTETTPAPTETPKTTAVEPAPREKPAPNQSPKWVDTKKPATTPAQPAAKPDSEKTWISPSKTPIKPIRPNSELVEAPLPKDPIARSNLFANRARALLLEEGKATEAMQLCQEAVTLNPRNDTAYGIMAKIRIGEAKYADAGKLARKAININHSDSAYWLTLGESMHKQARMIEGDIGAKGDNGELAKKRDLYISKATRAFQEVIRLAPGKKSSHESLGDIYYLQAKIADNSSSGQAEELYRKAIRSYLASFRIGRPTYRESFQLGVSHYRIGDMKQALTYLERAVEEARNVVPKEAFWYLALTNMALQQPRDALRYWEKAAKAYDKGSYRDEAKAYASKLRKQLGE